MTWKTAPFCAQAGALAAALTLAACNSEPNANASRGELAQRVVWTELSSLPDALGFAGPFVGVSQDALLVAGGANFPGGRPWDGHSKTWHDRIFVLEEPGGSWRVAEERLPRPTAYGISVTWRDSILCIGGGDAGEHFSDCYQLTRKNRAVEVGTLPSLPTPLAFFSGAVLGDVVYVMGGSEAPSAVECSQAFFALDMSQPPSERGWQALESWPGPSRMLSVAGVQSGALFLFGGVQLTSSTDGAPERVQPYLSDGYRFNPNGDGVHGTWHRTMDLPGPIAAAPTPAVAAGQSHLFLLAGADGTRGGAALKNAHPGFSPAMFAYHTVTDTWVGAGNFPLAKGPNPQEDPGAGRWPPVTTNTTEWRDATILASGEIRPGVRTPRVHSASFADADATFGWVNYAVLAVYLSSLLGMGAYFAKREKTTDDFFLAGRRVPWWAAGMSIFGTQLSAITFLALPAKSYATDWLYFIQNLGIVAIAPIVVCLYLPFFRRLNITTAYEYLEQRFNLAIRLFGSLSFVVFQLARMGIVILLPALALTAATGMDLTLCILAMGLLCTIYTVLGGIEAVIWTDVLQVVVLMAGAIIALIVMIAGVDGGASEVLSTANSHDKLRLADLSWDWTGPAIGVIVLGAFFNNLVPYSSDQAVVQRYLTTSSEKRAARAIWTGAWLSVPASILFFAVGTGLFAFYQHNPERLNATGTTDQIFAWFIVNELPIGVAGLVVAGVFAAAMSSLDSSMNSIAAVVTTDLKRLRPDPNNAPGLRFARGVTVVLGVMGTASALMLAQWQVTSLIDQFLGYVGLLGGTMAGLFALGILSRRATAMGAACGAVAAVAALIYVKTMTDLSVLLYAAVGMTTCVVVGYLASLLLPRVEQTLDGLTYRTLAGRHNS